MYIKHFHDQIVLAKQHPLPPFKETAINVGAFLAEPSTKDVLEHLPQFAQYKITHATSPQWGRVFEWNVFPHFLHIRLYIVFFQSRSPHANEFHDAFRFLQSVFLFFGRQLAQKSGLRRLHFHLFLTDMKKTFPVNPNAPFEEINVNSGFTIYSTSNPTFKDICIFRKEEWKKVAIHEIIHALNIEFSHSFSKQVDVWMGEHVLRGAVRRPLLLFETYVELWATILHILFSMGGIGPFRAKIFERKLLNEQLWSVIQYKRILGESPTKAIHSFSGGVQKSLQKRMRESPQPPSARKRARTAAQWLAREKAFVAVDAVETYAYFILKARFLVQLPLFLHFTGTSIYFEKTKEKLLAFFDCIVKLYSPPLADEWAQLCASFDLEDCRDFLEHAKLVEANSLRMTVTDS